MRRGQAHGLPCRPPLVAVHLRSIHRFFLFIPLLLLNQTATKPQTGTGPTGSRYFLTNHTIACRLFAPDLFGPTGHFRPAFLLFRSFSDNLHPFPVLSTLRRGNKRTTFPGSWYCNQTNLANNKFLAPTGPLWYTQTASARLVLRLRVAAQRTTNGSHPVENGCFGRRVAIPQPPRG